MLFSGNSYFYAFVQPACKDCVRLLRYNNKKVRFGNCRQESHPSRRERVVVTMKSIQTKFIALILGCVLLTSLVTGGAGILSAKRVVDEDSSQIMSLQCSEKAERINALLSRIEQSVNTLAVYATEQMEEVERLRTDDSYVDSYTKQIQDVAVNAANNTEGALAVYLRLNPDFAAPTSGLFWSKTSTDGSFQELTPTDFSMYNPEDVKHVGWYYIPVKSGKATWMNPYFNENIKVEMISYVIPIYKNNVTVGVVGMDIDFSVLKEIVDNTRVYTSGFAFLTDDQANIMYHKDYPMDTPLDSLDESLVPISKELKSTGSGNILRSYTWQGEARRMAFCNLQNGMRLAIAAPTSEIDREQNALTLQIVIALVVIAALAVLLTVVMTRRLIRPLKELNEAAKKIAEGDLSIALSRQSKDEVGTLADSFQQTVNHLQQYINYINGLAYRDGLTGVKNKTAYQEAAARLEEETRLGRPRFAVTVFDINNLKTVNDSCGHDFGDILIIDACKMICKVFKRSPVYRIGGDEFVVILENGDYERYKELLERFETEVEEFNQYARADMKLSIARGIALYEEETDLAFHDVFKRADESMYQNKALMKRKIIEEQEKNGNCSGRPE